MTSSIPETPTPTHKTEKTFDWVTIKTLVEFTNGQVTKNQLRWWLRHKDKNDLSKHVIYKGKKIYINLAGFLVWFEGIES